MSMTIHEFVELKCKLVSRAEEALRVHGCDMTTGLRVLQHRRELIVMTIFEFFEIKLPLRDGKFHSIYASRSGDERQLQWNHKELVHYYKSALEVIDRIMLLEDMANV